MTTQHSDTGQNFIGHQQRGYTPLEKKEEPPSAPVRDVKKRGGCTVPFTYQGPADLVSYEGDRPIRVVWRLRQAMPVGVFEGNRRGG